MSEQMKRLAVPFEPRFITWKPGSTTKDNAKCLAMAYADTRAYQERLDEVFGWEWGTEFEVISSKEVLCRLWVGSRTNVRSATGEDTDLMSAEARAFKRACSAFGLGRYLYDLPSVWVAYDAQRRRISDDGQVSLDKRYRDWYARAMQKDGSSAKPTQEAPKPIQQPEQAQQSANGTPSRPTLTADEAFGEMDKATTEQGTLTALHTLGRELYGAEWDSHICARNVGRLTNGKTESADDLDPDQVKKLMAGMLKLQAQREAEAQAA